MVRAHVNETITPSKQRSTTLPFFLSTIVPAHRVPPRPFFQRVWYLLAPSICISALTVLACACRLSHLLECFIGLGMRDAVETLTRIVKTVIDRRAVVIAVPLFSGLV
ncbi:uncharacterized protein ARMOST_14483 [Armillaria ostoyae]|uniref:Uncharacterized protein n=1 Tax=Armillaria ostoyae TaxID=47428 RepID=A0A284RQP6_ARMOS|nr:uncharacterized protein ARMOST_14483 [Armillaria ostoyae]